MAGSLSHVIVYEYVEVCKKSLQVALFINAPELQKSNPGHINKRQECYMNKFYYLFGVKVC